MSTAVVTGGAGFLGSHLCDYLLGEGNRVICVDNLDTGSLQNIEHIRSREFVLAKSGEHLPINLGNPDEMTLLELAETVIRITGSSSEIVFEALPVDDPQVRQPDITRARQLLAWEPEVGLEAGLRRLADGLAVDVQSPWVQV